MCFSRCCRARPREVNEGEAHPPSYCQKVKKSVTLAGYDTAAGAVAGAATAVPFGTYASYSRYSTALYADGERSVMQARIDNGTDYAYDSYGVNKYSNMRDVANSEIGSALVKPVILGALLGGTWGALIGANRIARTILFPHTVKTE